MTKLSVMQRFKTAFTVLKSGMAGWPFDRAPLDSGNSTSDLAQPFAQSAWVMRAIKKVAQPICAVPLKFSAGDTEMEDSALTAFWQNPSPGLTLGDFVEAITIWLKLDGEAFILLGDDSLRPFPELASYSPVVLARPDAMREVKSGGKVEGWIFTTPSGQRHTLLPEQVIHIRYFNPYDDVRGLAEYKAARMAAESDYAAGAYSRNLMQNNGDTGPIISVKSGTLSDQQQQQIINQLRMKQRMARQGDFRAAFLTSDVTVQQATAQVVSGDFANMRLGNRHEIFLAFGVPPSMADKMESYSVGSASDWFMLITETCIPASVKIAQAITQIVRRQTGKEITAAFDWDEHPVMQAVRRERIEAAVKFWGMGMPLRTASDYLDLDLPEFEGDDVGYISFGLTPAGSDATEKTKDDVALAEPDAVQMALKTVRALRLRRAALPKHKADCACCEIDWNDITAKAGDPADVKRWKSLVAPRRAIIRAYEAKFTRVLMLARAEVLQNIERAAQKSISTKAVAADLLFNLGEFTAKFQAAMRATGLNALQAAGDQLFKEVAKDDPWKMPAAETLQFLKERENALSNVPSDVFERIKTSITDDLVDGESLNTIANNIRAEFNEISKGRALTIASTETSAAFGAGRAEAMRAAGVQFKRWLVSGNSNVRAAHLAMNGAVVGIEESFTVINPKSGEVDKVDHPGESGGAPWNVINCHCIAVAVAAPETES
jgi:HK97 family phage portal protein